MRRPESAAVRSSNHYSTLLAFAGLRYGRTLWFSLDPRVIGLLPVPAFLSCARSARLRPSSLIEAPDIDQVDSEETPCGGGGTHDTPYPTDSSAQPALPVA